MLTISRRTFNKSALLAAIAGIGVTATASSVSTCRPIPWELFCDPETTRYSLGSPFVREGIKFATDSRIMIWAPTSEPDNDRTKRKIPDANSVAEMILDSDEAWQMWPKPAYFPGSDSCTAECWCYEGKTRKATCQKCNGYGGKLDYTGDLIEECGKCHGNGEVYFGPPCEHCGGTGKIDRLFQLSEGLVLDRRYDVLIRQLSDVIEWRAATVHEDKYGKGTCIAFRWPGGLGGVMTTSAERVR